MYPLRTTNVSLASQSNYSFRENKSKNFAIMQLFVRNFFHYNKECYMFDPQLTAPSFDLSFR